MDCTAQPNDVSTNLKQVLQSIEEHKFLSSKKKTAAIDQLLMQVDDF
jgi:hypothetical protein